MTKSPESRATLMMTTSLKGGTGKSLYACAFLDHLRAQSYPVAAYDGDGTIGTLSAMHASRDQHGRATDIQDPLTGVASYNVRGESRTELIASTERYQGLHLHDLAGGALADIQRIFDDEDGLANLFQAYRDLGIRPVYCHLITPDKATVESAAIHLDMMEHLGDLGRIAGHVAVINLRGQLKPDDFPFWYGHMGANGETIGSKTRERLLASGGVEMKLPHMNERVLALAKNQNMPLSAVIHASPLSMVDRQHVRQFVKAFAAEVTPEIRRMLGMHDG